ncbi:MAG: hypothetical protein Q9225_001909 [Loekoesia sp. 1 TL-2023]
MPRIEDANSLPVKSYRARFLPASLDPILVGTIHLQSHHVHFESSSTISTDDFNACLTLVASSSANAYAASSIGWSPSKKRKEMNLPDLRYLLLVDPSVQNIHTRVQGFLSFMLTYEDGHEVIYCYELHLTPCLQGQGLGKHLMSLMETVGSNAGVEKSMLTVFVENEGAIKFYQKLGYVKDEYSPQPRKLRNGTVKLPTYVILSKLLQQWTTDEEEEGAG